MNPNTPILVGVGQLVDRWDGADLNAAPSPADLVRDAARIAFDDSGVAQDLIALVDEVHVVRTYLDSIPNTSQPFGRCKNPPTTLADDLGITGAKAVYSEAGGQTPQKLVNEAAERIFTGTTKAVLLAGAEAQAAMRTAARAQHTLDWSRSSDVAMDDSGIGKPMRSPYEATNGLGRPTQTYPAFEQALRVRLGKSEEEHNADMAQVWESFSKVAASNPYSQFPRERSREFLSTPSRENYPVAKPYLKWHVAQDAVNQGASLILTSVREAERLGIERSKWIFLHSYAHAQDTFPSEREDLSRSRVMEYVLHHCIESSEITVDQIDHFDLYSCFPCAVFLAAEALGLDWKSQVLTVTGGLPFFGGAGNNYSMHAIATMAEILRKNPEDYGLVLANGGFLTKEAAGLYSTRPVSDWQPISSLDIQRQLDAPTSVNLLEQDTSAKITSYSVIFKRGVPNFFYVFAENDAGRILARSESGDQAMAQFVAQHDLIGATVDIKHEDGANIIQEFRL